MPELCGKGREGIPQNAKLNTDSPALGSLFFISNQSVRTDFFLFISFSRGGETAVRRVTVHYRTDGGTLWDLENVTLKSRDI